MVKNKSGDGNRKWWFLLGGLGVVILGLVICIIMVVSTKSDVQMVEDEESLLASSIIEINQDAEITGDVGAGIEAYNRKIESNIDNPGALLVLRIAFSEYLAWYDYNEDSLRQLDLVDKTELNSSQLAKLYAAYRNYYIYMEDSDRAMEYDRKIKEVLDGNSNG